MAAILAEGTTAHWLAFCDEHGIPCTRSASLQDLVDELPLAEHPVGGPYRQIPPPVRYSGSPASIRRPAPTIGEHGREVLAEVGFGEAELDELERDGTLYRD